MKKITILLEELILELSYSEIKAKYYSDIDPRVFDKITKADPRTKVGVEGNVLKIGNYAKLLINMYKDGNLKLEDLPKATEYLEIIYRKRLPLTDKVTSISDMYNLVSDYMVKEGETDINKLFYALEPNEYDIKHSGEKWLILSPKTEKSACVLGSGTEWCTSWGKYSTNPSNQGRDNYYNTHKKNLFILINKEDNSEKYQFHEATSQYMDYRDKKINVSELLKNNKELFLFFNPEFLTGLNNLDDEKLEQMITRVFMTDDAKDDVVDELVRRNGNMPIIKTYLRDVESDDFTETNKMLNSSDFFIENEYNGNISLRNFDDDDLEAYERVDNSDYGYDPYVDDEEVENYIDGAINAIFEKHAEDIKRDFRIEGLDVVDFIDFSNKMHKTNYSFNEGFLKNIIEKSNYSEKLFDVLKDIIGVAEHEAEKNAGREVSQRAVKYFDVSNKTINKNIFLSFLIYINRASGEQTLTYTMDDFKEFLSGTFDLDTDSNSIYESVQDLKWQLREVRFDNIVSNFDDYLGDIIENFMDNNEHDILSYNHTKNGNAPIDDLREKYAEFRERLDFVINKYGNTDEYEIDNDLMELKIFNKDINLEKDSVLIRFQSKKDDTSFEGYVKLSVLPKYLSYGTNSVNFYNKLEKTLSGLGLDKGNNEFENEHVIMKLDYDKIDILDETIFMELTNKETNKTISGMVKLDSIPSHFTNYKLFEYVIRYKKLI